jgi:6-phosphogluconolactonase
MIVKAPSGREADIVVVDNEDALAERVADRFIGDARAAIASHGRFNVALAGGTTPKAAYGLLARDPRRGEIEWEKIRFFFGDERCVAPADDESNYKMARVAMFDPLRIDPANVFRMRGEDDPERAAAAYGDVLRAQLGQEPRFDLIMLGMGPDGHTASLFPGSSPATDDRLLVNAPFVPKFGTHRITFTPRVINNAGAVVIATAGPTKTDVLGHVLRGPYDPNTYPVQIVAPVHGTLTWYVDRAAAAKLGL